MRRVSKPVDLSPEHNLGQVIVQPKIDGMRFYVDDGVVRTSSNKPFPNQWIQWLIPCVVPDDVEGEIGVGPATDIGHFQKTQSVATADSALITDLHLYIFDKYHPTHPYIDRLLTAGNDVSNKLVILEEAGASTSMPSVPLFSTLDAVEEKASAIKQWWPSFLQNVRIMPNAVHSMAFAYKKYEEYLELGYEGAIYRKPNGIYKEGRDSPSDPSFVRSKPMVDTEAVIVGFAEQQENTNPIFVNNKGLSARSSAKAGKKPSGTLGSFLVHLLDNPSKVFSVGNGEGLTHNLRKHIWDNQERYLGKIIKIQYQKSGTKDKPRIPKYLGFRSEIDL